MTLSPAQNKERIWIMDALRGFAILGIFIANLGTGFTWYDPSANNTGQFFSSFDKQMLFLHHMLIEGKFYSIFSFLFGWGVALQLGRSESNLKPVSFVRRRLFIMFLLGLAHIILLWPGDIVAFYALVGFVLLWIRNWKDKTLFITSIILLLSPILLYFIKMKWPAANAPAEFMFKAGQIVGCPVSGICSEQDYLNYIQNMTYWKMVKMNVSGFFFRFGDLFFQSRISKVLGMFILGYLIGKNFRYKQIISNNKLLWTIAIAGLLIGLPGNYFQALFNKNQGDYYNLTQNGLYRTIAYAFGVVPLALAYISLFFLIAKTTLGEKILSPFKPVGKMAFTNYILQSVVGIFVFQSFGLNFLGKVGPVYFTIFALGIFILQIIISKIWLSYFQFGPVEWLWRSATYRQRQGLRKRKY